MQLSVYFDVFHAVQRVTKVIPKRHPYHKHCLNNLSMVFRDPSDRGPIRSMPTPSPSILRENLNSFHQRWLGVTYNGREILPHAAVKEINCLMKHINRGCLSGIKPGRGTNRKERLHRELNKILSSSCYGVELGYALLTSTFYNHNEHIIRAMAEKRTPRPISMLTPNSVGVQQETFGISNVIVDALLTSTFYNHNEHIIHAMAEKISILAPNSVGVQQETLGISNVIVQWRI